MSEIISLGLGNAGCNILQKSFELFSIEHDISNDGQLGTVTQGEDCKMKVYSENSQILKPRALFIDSDSNSLECIQNSVFRRAYDSNQFVKGSGDSCVTYAAGHYMRDQCDVACEAVRRQVEACIYCEGFMLYNANGGFGSGFTSLMTEHLCVDFPKKQFLNFNVQASEYMCTPTEIINNVLSNSVLSSTVQCTYMMGNDAVKQICSRNLGIENNSFYETNQIIAHAISAATLSIRFGGACNDCLREFETNFVLYPQFHYLFQAVSPLLSRNETYENLNKISLCDVKNIEEPFFGGVVRYGPRPMMVYPVTEFIYNCLTPDSSPYPRSQLLKCDCLGRHIAALHLFQGDLTPSQARSDMFAKTKWMMRFLDWSYYGLKCSIMHQPVRVFHDDCIKLNDRMCSVTHNSTSVKCVFTKQREHVEGMLRRKEFVHQYVREGMEEGELSEAIEWSKQLEADYNEAEIEGKEAEAEK